MELSQTLRDLVPPRSPEPVENYTGPQIALGYACAYPLGVVGIISVLSSLSVTSSVSIWPKKKKAWKKGRCSTTSRTWWVLRYATKSKSAWKTLIEIKEFWTSVCLFPYPPMGTSYKYPESWDHIQYGGPVIYCLFRRRSAITVFIGKEVELGLGESRIFRWFPAVFGDQTGNNGKRSVPCISVVCMVSTLPVHQPFRYGPVCRSEPDIAGRWPCNGSRSARCAVERVAGVLVTS